MVVDDVQLTLPCCSISPTPTPAPRANTRPEATPDAEAAPLSWLENVKVELARDSRGAPAAILAERKALCFACECLRSKRALRTLAASIQRARTVIRPLHLRCSLQPPNASCRGGYVDR